MKKTHWKKLAPSNYLGAWDIENDTNVTILSITQEKIKPNASAPEEECVVMKLKEFNKPMIVNKTNLKAIEKATGSAYIEDWKGRQIILFSTKVRAFGDMVDALRVRQFAPKPKEKPTLTDDRFKVALEKIKSGEIDKSSLTPYNLTKEQTKLISEL